MVNGRSGTMSQNVHTVSLRTVKRMEHAEELDDKAIEIMDEKNMENNEKRKRMYRAHVFDKYGYLGKGERKQIHRCVIAYIAERFPPPANEDLMGHRDE